MKYNPHLFLKKKAYPYYVVMQKEALGDTQLPCLCFKEALFYIPPPPP